MDYQIYPGGKNKKVESEETPLGTGVRNIARIGLNAASGVAGRSGDLASGALGLFDLGTQGLQKVAGTKEPQKAAKGPYSYNIPPGDTSPIRGVLPSSENIAKVGKAALSPLLPRNYLEPQSETEEVIDEIATDFGSLLNPKDWLANGIKNIYKAPNLVKNVATAAGLSGLGNFAKWGAKSLGAGPLGQALAKGGTMLFTSLVGPYGAEKAMKSLYSNAEDLKPKGVKVPHAGLVPVIKEIEDVVEKTGFPTKSKEFLKEPLAGLKSNVERPVLKTTRIKRFIPKPTAANPKPIERARPSTTKIKYGPPETSLDHVLQLKHDINEVLRDPSLPTESTGLLMKAANRVNGLIDSAAHEHPEFLQNYRQADDIWQGLYQGNRVSRFLSRNVNMDKFAHPLTYAAFGIGGHALGLTGAAVVTVSALAAVHGYKIVESVARSKTLQRLYSNAVTASIKGLKVPAARAIHQFDQALRKELKEEDEGEDLVVY